MGRLRLGPFNVDHYITAPSKSSDYDYDPSRPYRRFISTFLHHLEFRDIVVGNVLQEVMFSTEVALNIAGVIKNTIGGSRVSSSVRDIFIPGVVDSPVFLTLSRSEDYLVLTFMVIEKFMIGNNVSGWPENKFILNLSYLEAEQLALELESSESMEEVSKRLSMFYT